MGPMTEQQRRLMTHWFSGSGMPRGHKWGDPGLYQLWQRLPWMWERSGEDLRAGLEGFGGGALGTTRKTLFDYSRLARVPDVPQANIPRKMPARGSSARAAAAAENPGLWTRVNELVEQGKKGGMEWYNTDPLRERFIAAFGPEQGAQRFARFMDYVGATSPRTKVAENIRSASYPYHLEMTRPGVPHPAEPGGYPSIYRGPYSHRLNSERIRATGQWPLENPKPAAFSQNLQGNQIPGTLDMHWTRAIGMLSEDPRWLSDTVAGTQKNLAAYGRAMATKTQRSRIEEIAKPSQKEKAYADIGTKRLQKLMGAEKIEKFNPKALHKQGKVPLQTALKLPTWWGAQPKAATEYPILEAAVQREAGKMGISPAQHQASLWTAMANRTGVADATPFLRTFEDRLNKTAEVMGISPAEVLDAVIKGKMPLK